MEYDSYDHYWEKDNNTLFSSARTIYVAKDDFYYRAWLEMGGAPTPYPKNADGSYDERAMYLILYPLGILEFNPEMHESI